MICCCALAGTRACENCNRKAEYEGEYVFKPNTINIPNTPYVVVDNSDIFKEKRLQEIENAIKRLNGRIDEIESE